MKKTKTENGVGFPWSTNFDGILDGESLVDALNRYHRQMLESQIYYYMSYGFEIHELVWITDKRGDVPKGYIRPKYAEEME